MKNKKKKPKQNRRISRQGHTKNTAKAINHHGDRVLKGEASMTSLFLLLDTSQEALSSEEKADISASKLMLGL